ncbi:MAG: hypothetical protein M3N23_07730 [Pseudomonadota bacterium]|nr:hypothetical protein [Pseudomonadota bacterium]
MNRLFAIGFCSAMTVLASGCASVAPAYSPSLENVQTLKNGGTAPVKLGTFASTASSDNRETLSMRGSTLSSPYNNSYAGYLSEALKQELTLANRLAPSVGTEVSGTLLKNTVDASGFTTGSTDISARFVVKKGGQVSYDQVKSIHHEFPSSFAGAVAIPRAIQEYAFAVQKLLGQLYSDAGFTAAIK